MGKSPSKKSQEKTIILGAAGKRFQEDSVRQRAAHIMQTGSGTGGGSFMEDIGVNTHSEFPGSPKGACPAPPSVTSKHLHKED